MAKKEILLRFCIATVCVILALALFQGFMSFSITEEQLGAMVGIQYWYTKISIIVTAIFVAVEMLLLITQSEEAFTIPLVIVLFPIVSFLQVLVALFHRYSDAGLLQKRDCLMQKIRTFAGANRPLPFRAYPITDSGLAERIGLDAVPERARDELEQLQEIEAQIAKRCATSSST